MTTRDPQHSRAVVQLLITALFWSFGGLLVKWIPWPPLAVAAGRAMIAAAFLLAVKRGLRFTWSPVQLGAALAYALCTVSVVVATKLTTAANAILLQYTAPVWVALLGTSFLGERVTRSDWAAIGVAFLGMTLFFADSLQLKGTLGIGLGMFSGISYAVMTLLMRKQKNGSVIESAVLGNLLGSVIGLYAVVNAPPLPAAGWAALITLGVVQLGFPYLLYARAIKHVTALEAVLIPVLEPILNPIWVMLFLSEKPGVLSLCGGVLVLAAVTWRALHSIRRPVAIGALAE